MTKVGAFLAGCTLCLAACSGGGNGGGTVTTPVTATPAPFTVSSGVAVNLQPANTTVTYQAAATDAVGQSPTVVLTTDASGNLATIVFNVPGSPGSFSSQSHSLSSPLNVDA